MDANRNKTELQRHLEAAGEAMGEGGTHAARPGGISGGDVAGKELAGKVRDASDRVSEAAGGVYESARRYARAATGQDSEGGVSVSASVEDHPLAALIVAGVVGYAVGWMIHGRPNAARGEPLPDYARKWG